MHPVDLVNINESCCKQFVMIRHLIPSRVTTGYNHSVRVGVSGPSDGGIMRRFC